jgi:hypothetical protein
MKLFCNSKYAKGEICTKCKNPKAPHKVYEEIFDDDPMPYRHPFTAYLCCSCFEQIMGPGAKHD